MTWLYLWAIVRCLPHRVDHPLVRLRLAWSALVIGSREARLAWAPLSHREAFERAALAWQYSQLPGKYRRQARRVLRRTRQAYPAGAWLYASIASPTGMGNDGQKAYDLSTRTWFGTMVGTLIAAGGKPFFDVTNPSFAGGAKVNGINDDSGAINAAITAAGVAGGMVLMVPGSYAANSSILLTQNIRILILAWGAFLKPAANVGDALRINQRGDGTDFGCEVYGLQIDGQSFAGVNGVRFRDTCHAVLRNIKLVNLVNGVILETFAAGKFSEKNALHDVHMANISGTGLLTSTVAGTGSLGETHMFNVGITQCPNPMNLVNGSTFYRCRLLGITIWCQTNAVGLTVDCNVTDCVWIIDFENLQGTATGITGATVTANAVGVQTVDAHFGFTGNFANKVTDASNLGLAWREGTWQAQSTSAFIGAGGINKLVQAITDAQPRLGAFGAFAGGGGFKFGDGTNFDATWYRVLANTLKTDGAFARSRQTPTETVLVSGVDATAGELVGVTLTAARLVGAPLNPSAGDRLTFTLIQGGAGGFAVTWNAIFKGITGGTSGATGTRASFSFTYDGTNWNLDGAQPTWV